MNSNKRRLVGTIAAAATAAAVLVPATSAQAETTRVNDGADATGSLTDIQVLRVRHGSDQVRVSASFTDLRKHSDGSAGAAVFIDTRSGRKGPEFVLLTGLEYATDYQLVKVRNWKPVGEPLNCDHKVSLKYQQDVMKFRADRSCFANPAKVRVAMRMDDHSDGSHVITDWVSGRRKFTDWLARG
ncbi:hypothetical protein ASG90_08530 [Nocardioides sp. Soil797]|nr:hypothetical protein ASG90_08530 [Nocardioides sp. Soil797]